MANECAYTMKAVGKDRAALERVLNIMQYKDTEFFLYRVFSADSEDGVCDCGDGYFSIEVYGAVAWACNSWIHDAEDLENTDKLGAHYSNFPAICRALKVGVEIFAEEEGCAFQEHIRVDCNGEITWDECADWHRGFDYFDENGNPCDEDRGFDFEPNEEKDEGGVDGYGNYSTAEEIYFGHAQAQTDKADNVIYINKGSGKCRLSLTLPKQIIVDGEDFADAVDSVALYINDHADEIFTEIKNH